MPGVGLAAWGKFEPPGQFHRLEHHCADVAACFEALLRDPVFRDRFERASGGAGLCPVTEARLTVIAYLHDFGKLDTGFQFNVRDGNAWPCGTQPRKAGHIGKALGLPEMKRAVQEATLDNPLLILEGETGAGKTEAAILRFVDLWRAGRVDGLYLALPIRAAAKQVHARVRRALNRLFPDEPWAETVLAIPGYPMAGTAGVWREEDFKVYPDYVRSSCCRNTAAVPRRSGVPPGVWFRFRTGSVVAFCPNGSLFSTESGPDEDCA